MSDTVQAFVEADYITIEEAAEMLNLRRSQARAVLGEPDHTWLSAAGRMQFIFKISRVLEIKEMREEKLRKKIAEHGLRSCGHCHNKFDKKTLHDGLCCGCQAKKIVRHFCCKDFLSKKIDLDKLQTLVEAIRSVVKQEIESTP